MILNFNNKKEAITVAKRYNLYEDGLIFKIYKKHKLVYGLFDNYEDAKAAMDKLNPFILKNRPFVRKISGYQRIYKKYKQRVED
jgi:hypothetical protein